MGHAVRSQDSDDDELAIDEAFGAFRNSYAKKNMTAEFNRIQMDQMMSAEPSKECEGANWNPAIRETTKTRAQLRD